jgi:hypothetical protein
MNLQVNFEHELDISWLIALWFAIHGGDPSPEGGVFEVSEETYALAHGLVENLLATYGRYGARALSNAELEVRLREVVNMHHVPPSLVPKLPPEGGVPNTGPGGLTIPPSCWHVSATQIRCWSVGSHFVAPTNPVKPE